MTRLSLVSRFRRDQDGAVASVYALSLVGLVAMAGIAYDFAQVASVDTEVQNAADQAALAAATQLNGQASALTNADTAARTYVSNTTIFASDGKPAKLSVTGLVFYSERADAEADNEAKATTDPAKAHFVKVTLESRRAKYTLTPIVGLFTSPNIGAAATAGLGSAVCRVPPLMMCNLNSDPGVFNVDSIKGKGILLKATGGGGAYAPGDFGFLDAGTGASDLAKLMGYPSSDGKCVDVASPSTQPGAVTSVINEYNTRFDIYDQGDSIGCYKDGLCPPSDNSRKDVVQSGKLTTASPFNKTDCGLATGKGKAAKGWQVSPNPYRPTAAQKCSATNPCGETGSVFPDMMGFPRDIMHAWHAVTGADRIGDGVWDIEAYWQSNYGTTYPGSVPKSVPTLPNPTRYDVYKWERANAPASRQFVSGGDDYTSFKSAVCLPGYTPASQKVDRRVLPIAVVNCTGLSGKSEVRPLDWVDVFLVEPSIARGKGSTSYTSVGEIYVEVIGLTGQGTGGTASQFVRRDKPILVR